MTFGCGFFSVDAGTLKKKTLSVIGLSQDTVRGTALPFSISAGTSILSLPLLSGASPTTFLIAARIDAGVAGAGAASRARPIPAALASAAVSTKKRRRV